MGESIIMPELLPLMTQAEYILRIILAGICGMIIGLERKNRSKEAGIRTHFVVACGAALMMVVSKYAFFDIICKGIYEGVEVRLDPSRIASTIASGIGFLGAGMIFVHKNTITGLTTAAGIWATSGVGMAIGAGLYAIGVTSTVIILIAQILLHMNFSWIRLPKTKRIIIDNVDDEQYQQHLSKIMEDLGVIIHDVSIDKDVSTRLRKYTFTAEIPVEKLEDDIISKIDYDVSIRN